MAETQKTKKNDADKTPRKTLSIRMDTYARLATVGRFGDTSDDLINRLVDQLEAAVKKA